MRIIFMGTSEFAVPSLEALVESGNQILTVFTQPDRKSGRGQNLRVSPVKQAAIDHGLKLAQPETLKEQQVADCIRRLDPTVIVVIAYGKILPESILNIPLLGCINVHGSLLPAYRGAAPIQRSIMAGDRELGITTMYMDRTMDTGDIILQSSILLSGDEDHGLISSRLAIQGADTLLRTLELMELGTAPRISQDNTRATYAPPLTAEDELIQWKKSSSAIKAQILGLSPVPGAYTWYKDNKLKIFRAEVVEENHPGTVGEIVKIFPDRGFVVRTGLGGLLVLEVQKPGKKRMTAVDFLKGNALKEGDLLEAGVG